MRHSPRAREPVLSTPSGSPGKPLGEIGGIDHLLGLTSDSRQHGLKQANNLRGLLRNPDRGPDAQLL